VTFSEWSQENPNYGNPFFEYSEWVVLNNWGANLNVWIHEFNTGQSNLVPSAYDIWAHGLINSLLSERQIFGFWSWFANRNGIDLVPAHINIDDPLFDELMDTDPFSPRGKEKLKTRFVDPIIRQVEREREDKIGLLIGIPLVFLGLKFF
jgi:hypothetical protein